jgi:hypothetical protein
MYQANITGEDQIIGVADTGNMILHMTLPFSVISALP